MFSRAAKPQDRQGSTIGPDASLTGDIVSVGSLHVDGTIHGNVRCARLSQGPGGVVHGNIVAEEARLAGLIDGAVEAGALVLDASARVTGDILYESVGIAPGAQVEGRLRRRKGPADHGAAAARAEVARSEVAEASCVDTGGLSSAAVGAEPDAAPVPTRVGKRGRSVQMRGLELFAPSVEAAE